MPLVSILIPAHNASPWIAETIDSALAQSWADREVIVVDDGSTDETVAIARRYEPQGVRVFTQENQGAGAARNRAWAESHGAWLQFLDADDLLHPEKISRQMDMAARLGPDFIYCSQWTRFTRSIADADYTPQPLCADSDPVAWIELKLRENVMMHPAAWLVSRKLADRAGPWDTTLSLDDDGEFFSRVVLASAGVRIARDALTYYRSNLSGSLSRHRSPQAWASAYKSLQLTTARLKAVSSTAATTAAVANAYQQLAYAMYPDEPALVRTCEMQAASNGGSSIRPGGGIVFSMIARLFGWRLARRIQRLRAT
jgi:glycosyltransferase involved in cell wall biosynthesis